eukprot:m.89006 g.89006  ORF g.89006 m.89006 type:complete len:411 (+) comp11694_c0_seq1:186-1418(+)
MSGADCCELVRTENWGISSVDTAVVDQEIESWLPHRIFDAHAHVWCNAHWGGPMAYRNRDASPPQLYLSCPFDNGCAGWEEYVNSVVGSQTTFGLHAGRATHALFIPIPDAGMNVRAANIWAQEQARKDPTGLSRALMLVTPKTLQSEIDEAVSNGVVGLKCYHCFAEPAVHHACTFDAPISAYLPEHLVARANHHGLSITLHMVRQRALSDRGNQATIREYCTKYPRMRLILAHAARGFNMHHTINGLNALRGLSNVYFDTAAVTESGALEAILRDKDFGPSRVLYGSDFPITHIRGRCVGVGDSFLWIAPNNCDLTAAYAHGGVIQTALVGVEALRALKLACDNTEMCRGEIEAIMYGNAAQLFNINQGNAEFGDAEEARGDRFWTWAVAATALVFILAAASRAKHPS